jgi:ribosomal protein S18 acetylase RimI-like enzyme
MRDISIRAAEAADSEFAYRVLERTMREVAVAAWGKWSEAEGRERTASDARAGRSQIIQWGSEPVGLLCVDKLDTHTQLDQLYVLPDYQRRGIGAEVLQLILSEARSAKRPVRLRVLRANPAKNFYARHGFKVISETAERLFMEYAPPREHDEVSCSLEQ